MRKYGRHGIQRQQKTRLGGPALESEAGGMERRDKASHATFSRKRYLWKERILPFEACILPGRARGTSPPCHAGGA